MLELFDKGFKPAMMIKALQISLQQVLSQSISKQIKGIKWNQIKFETEKYNNHNEKLTRWIQ